MYALPRELEQYNCPRIAGQIQCPNRMQRVTHGGLDQGFMGQLITRIHRVAAPDPPPTTPSRTECAFCDITIADCPERVDLAAPPDGGTTDDF